MVAFDENTTVRDIVVNHPRARPVFEKLGIDYCCGGSATLGQAAQQKGIESTRLLAALEDAILAAGPAEECETNWANESVTSLVEHIEQTHHTFMKEQLPRVQNLLVKVVKAHEATHGRMLSQLQSVYQSLRMEIEQHLMKEEQILFPYIRQIADYALGIGEKPLVHCGSIQNPIRQMEHEHDNAGDALARMRELTSDYDLPGDACPTFEALYEGLKSMEADLHEHIHLENNILFPKAADLEVESGVI
ncbi:MAG: iron-sulfur cluster repair di-iron protein [Candidatus Abyssubacteria bacterium]